MWMTTQKSDRTSSVHSLPHAHAAGDLGRGVLSAAPASQAYLHFGGIYSTRRFYSVCTIAGAATEGGCKGSVERAVQTLRLPRAPLG